MSSPICRSVSSMLLVAVTMATEAPSGSLSGNWTASGTILRSLRPNGPAKSSNSSSPVSFSSSSTSSMSQSSAASQRKQIRHIKHVKFSGLQTESFTFVDAVLLSQEVGSLAFIPEHQKINKIRFTESHNKRKIHKITLINLFHFALITPRHSVTSNKPVDTSPPRGL